MDYYHKQKKYPIISFSFIKQNENIKLSHNIFVSKKEKDVFVHVQKDLATFSIFFLVNPWGKESFAAFVFLFGRSNQRLQAKQNNNTIGQWKIDCLINIAKNNQYSNNKLPRNGMLTKQHRFNFSKNGIFIIYICLE